MPELPAGMLDGSGSFSGTAAKEIEEETGQLELWMDVMHPYSPLNSRYTIGLIIEERELTDMTELAYGNKWRGIYPSAGGSGMKFCLDLL